MEKEGGKKDIGITEHTQMKEMHLNKIRILKNEKQGVLLKTRKTPSKQIVRRKPVEVLQSITRYPKKRRKRGATL